MSVQLVRGSATTRCLAIASLVLGLGFLAWLPFMVGSFRVFQLTLVLIWAVSVMGLNLLVGYSGQISIGHNALFAVGAYTAAILMHRYDTNVVLCLVAAATTSGLVGLLVGIPALRLQGLHLAIVTLALAMATTAVLQRFGSLTGGAAGLSVPRLRPPSWLPIEDEQYVYLISLVVAVVMFVIARNLTSSAFGRALVAIKDNPLAAAAMGIDSRIYKALTFAMSGVFAGVAGVLYVLAIRYVSPEAFPLLLSVTFLAAIAVGGLGTISGAIVGAAFVQFVPQFASSVNDSLATLLYGVVLIVVMIVMPTGIVGLAKRLLGRVVTITDPPVPPVAGDDEPFTESPPAELPEPVNASS
ncbi:branched-chain amino acid ABC transporter permease [Desertimonas flava]|uniref:branched-chain amino acid ABC transporter permease n=1 Tax=Desertimonas flava TaxID=2064846 RepID=UPI000E347DAE|nr:branched-chain amino acid ABC transporter permease [Desertimonas flava]